MGSIKTTVGFLALAASALAPSSACAWGNEGHQIIALIAYDRLTPAARAEVADLLGGDARPTLEDVSTWADYIRLTRPDTAPWHYVNIEITASGYNAATDCPVSNCVVAQVERDARIIADHQLAKPVRAEALRFLIHFVGDLHQPLHCADNHDRGGNEVAVLIGTEQTNLHAVWDTDVVAALGQDPEHVASALGAQIMPADEPSWSRGSPVAWANESFGIAKHAIYSSLRGEGGTEAPIILPSDYAARMRPVTATQLKRAGVRLARLLNEGLAHPLAQATQPARTSLDTKAGPLVAVAADPITPEAAASHVGETATIKGVVAQVYTSRSGVTFLDMGARYPDNPFAAVIFPEDADKFPDVGSLSGKVVEVTGSVRVYKGKPEIILRTADQLEAE